MKKGKFSETQILTALKEHESGKKVSDIVRELSISSATFYLWQKRYSGMNGLDMRRLRELEEENRKLKQMYADLAMDNKVLKDVISKKF
jgi:putative transposase